MATGPTAVIPHSSYLGVYPDVVSRSEARHRLQMRGHEIVLLMLGAIRPYKGLSLLLDVFDELCRSDPRFRLLVVGQPSHEPESARWKDRCEHHPRIVASFGRAADEDLQIWCRAADLAVLPYVSVLNSGWFQLAISFDLPVVGARDGVLADLLDPAYSEGSRRARRQTFGGRWRWRRAASSDVWRSGGPSMQRHGDTLQRQWRTTSPPPCCRCFHVFALRLAFPMPRTPQLVSRGIHRLHEGHT